MKDAKATYALAELRRACHQLGKVKAGGTIDRATALENAAKQLGPLVAHHWIPEDTVFAALRTASTVNRLTEVDSLTVINRLIAEGLKVGGGKEAPSLDTASAKAAKSPNHLTSHVASNLRWREANRSRYNQFMKPYMRLWRARQRLSAEFSR